MCTTPTAAWLSTLHEGEAAAPVRSALIGDYNVAQPAASCSVALRALGLPLADAAAVVPRPDAGARAHAARRRGRPPEVVVDYAHTPDALDKVLPSLRPLAAARGGRAVVRVRLRRQPRRQQARR